MTDDMSEANVTEYSASGQKEEETFNRCPTCGIEAEGIVTCPECGARVTKGIPIKIFKSIAGAGLVLGFFLLMAATYLTAPTIFEISFIGEVNDLILDEIEGEPSEERLFRALSEVRNYVRYPGHVSYSEPDELYGDFSISVNPARIRGRVQDITLQEGANNFTLTLSDGEQEVDARGFNALSDFRDQLGDRFPPNLFDKVEVTGSLNFSSRWGASLYLGVPNRLRVLDEFEEQSKVLGDIVEEDLGEYYWVEGRVTDVFRPGEIRIITLECLVVPGAKFELAVPDFIYNDLPPEEQELLVGSGNELELFVRITEFRGDLQLSLARDDEPGYIRRAD